VHGISSRHHRWTDCAELKRESVCYQCHEQRVEWRLGSGSGGLHTQTHGLLHRVLTTMHLFPPMISFNPSSQTEQAEGSGGIDEGWVGKVGEHYTESLGVGFTSWHAQ